MKVLMSHLALLLLMLDSPLALAGQQLAEKTTAPKASPVTTSHQSKSGSPGRKKTKPNEKTTTAATLPTDQSGLGCASPTDK